MWKNVKQSITFNIIIIILGFFLATHAWRILEQALIVKEEMVKKKENVQVLEQKRSELQVKILELQTKEAVRREAKERLNLKLPGEEVVVVVPAKKNKISVASSTLTWWDRLKQILKIF